MRPTRESKWGRDRVLRAAFTLGLGLAVAGTAGCDQVSTVRLCSELPQHVHAVIGEVDIETGTRHCSPCTHAPGGAMMRISLRDDGGRELASYDKWLEYRAYLIFAFEKDGAPMVTASLIQPDSAGCEAFQESDFFK